MSGHKSVIITIYNKYNNFKKVLLLL